MPDFSRPEYASYVALCRELKLKRAFQSGDWLEIRYARTGLADGFTTGVWGSGYDDWPDDSSAPVIWLPALSDWLEMLATIGNFYAWVEIHWEGDEWAISVGPHHNKGRFAMAPTREEAAARLWVHVAQMAEAH